MEFIELTAKTRTKTGKSPARELRRQGMLPAVLYGPDTEPVLLSVNEADLEDGEILLRSGKKRFHKIKIKR